LPLHLVSTSDLVADARLFDAIKKVCPDPALQWVSRPATAGLPGGRTAVYLNPTILDVHCLHFFQAANASIPVVMRAASPGEKAYETPWFDDTNLWMRPTFMRENPGFTQGSWETVAPFATTKIDVLVEPSDDVGRGYWAYDINDEKIAQPVESIVAHEMGHVGSILDGNATAATTYADSEQYGLRAEADFRASRGLPQRYGHDGGTNFRKAGGYTPSACYIATAAYGSDLEPPVQELRELRDSVILQTRAGTKVFEAFYEKYYSFSPAVGEMMARDPAAKDLLGWGLVEPLIGYLRLARDFPRQDLESVPEPWRSYLSSMRDDFVRWTARIELPADLAGLSFGEALAEVRVAAGALTWSPTERKAFLTDMVARGQLPLQAPHAERAEAAVELLEEGFDPATVVLVLGGDAVPRGVVR
jgi:hypothetical protein